MAENKWRARGLGVGVDKESKHTAIDGDTQDAGCAATVTLAGECSGAGTCENGVCYCTLGYSGERVPPV